jgi:hypothetical protein
LEEFNQIYLIGFNENKCFSTNDEMYFEFLSIGCPSIENKKHPFILGSHQPDEVSMVSAKIAKRYLEHLIMHSSMPDGVSYKKPKGIDLPK